MPRPKKIYKSLDDDDDDIVPDDVNKATKEDDDDEITGVAPEELAADILEEEYQVSGGNGEDDGELSITSIRRNAPPPKSWDDGKVLKYKTGDLVIVKGYTLVYKILGAGREENTYAVKSSGSDSIQYLEEQKIKKAPADSIWKDYWDTICDPYRAWKAKQDEKAKLESIKKGVVTKEVFKENKVATRTYTKRKTKK